MRIIVRAPNWVGDCVLSIPALRDLRRGYPRAEIVIAAGPGTGELFAAAGLADGIIDLPADRGWTGLRRASRRLREGAFDAGLLLTNSFGSALLFYLAGLPERWGYAADGRSLLLTRPVPRPRPAAPRHHVYYYLDLVAGLGLEAGPPDLKIDLQAKELGEADGLLAGLGIPAGRPLLTLCPGAGFGPAKRWPARHFAAAASRLQDRRGAEVLIVGSAAEAGIADEVRREMTRPPHVLTGGTSLRQLMGVLARSTLVLANDSGPMHLAVALGVPVVAVFGPTDPAATGPFTPPSRFLKRDVPCWPCFYRRCPLDHRCMTLVPPDEAAAAAEALWP